MALVDLLLRMKVNMALARDPRVSLFDIGVEADQGWVILTGDVDTPEEAAAAVEIAQSVDGVAGIRDSLTVGIGKSVDTADMVGQQFLSKLEEEWDNLPDRAAMVQCDYMQWALWMIYKFRIPDAVVDEDRARIEADTKERAFHQLSGHLGVPVALLAWLLQNQAQKVSAREMVAPEIVHAPLVATPAVGGEETLAAQPA